MTVHHIVPPYLLEHLERTADDPNLRTRYRRSLEQDATFRTRPATTTGRAAGPSVPSDQGEPTAATPQRAVHDAEQGTTLPGRLVRAEGDPEVDDAAVNESYDGLGATWTMYSARFGRDSIDGAGLPLVSTVHYDRDYANAFWDGRQMVFGDGDGVIFRSFTSSIDITAHELTHGVVQHTADLTYEGQSGALNESIADVFGSLAKQHHLGQDAATADWIIGAGLFTDDISGVGLRSLAAPGTAYDDPRLGRDPQPAHMSGYVETTEDNGGVHINSGIPNHAFYLVATTLGGNAYEAAGRIWYETLVAGDLPASCTFSQFADATEQAARGLFGAESPEAAAVTRAWREVGVRTDQPESEEPSEPPGTSAGQAEPSELLRAAGTTLNTHTPPAVPGGGSDEGAEPAGETSVSSD